MDSRRSTKMGVVNALCMLRPFFVRIDSSLVSNSSKICQVKFLSPCMAMRSHGNGLPAVRKRCSTTYSCLTKNLTLNSCSLLFLFFRLVAQQSHCHLRIRHKKKAGSLVSTSIWTWRSIEEFEWRLFAKLIWKWKRFQKNGNSPFLTCTRLKGKWTQRHFFPEFCVS